MFGGGILIDGREIGLPNESVDWIEVSFRELDPLHVSILATCRIRELVNPPDLDLTPVFGLLRGSEEDKVKATWTGPITPYRGAEYHLEVTASLKKPRERNIHWLFKRAQADLEVIYKLLYTLQREAARTNHLDLALTSEVMGGLLLIQNNMTLLVHAIPEDGFSALLGNR